MDNEPRFGREIKRYPFRQDDGRDVKPDLEKPEKDER